MATQPLLALLSLVLVFAGGNSELVFHFENDCRQTLWKAASPSDGELDPQLWPDTLEIFNMDDPWSGSIWVRTKCSTNGPGLGMFSCETGDCGSGDMGNMDCQGPPPKYPVTLLNFDIKQNVVSYEVSLIHGHNNIPVRIQPVGGTLVEGGSGPCPVVDCVEDISNVCPADLVAFNKDGVYVGCYSACDGFKDPKFCESKPNQYSQLFKQLCGSSHTYPGDNVPPLYKCSGATSYNITFCPI